MEGILSNLAAPPAGTNAAEAPEAVRTHIIDRLSGWAAIAAGTLFGLLLLVGWDRLGTMARDGHLWLLFGLGLTLAVAASALVFRLLISPIVGDQIRGLAEAAEAIAAGDLSVVPEAATEGGQLGRAA